MFLRFHREVALAGALLAAVVGCRDSASNRSHRSRPARPVVLSGFGRGSTLSYHIESESSQQVTLKDRTLAIGTNESFVLSLSGSDEWLNVELSELEFQCSADGRETIRLNLNDDGLSGRKNGEPLHKAAGASEAELETLAGQILGGPLARLKLNANFEEVERSRRVLLGADVIVSPGVVDYASLLVVPNALPKQQWKRKCTYPVTGNVAAKGELIYRVSDDDWKQRDTKWFWSVHVEGTMTADGNHELSLQDNIADAKAGKAKLYAVSYHDSRYKISGDLRYSRQIGQFDSGSLSVEMQQRVVSGEEETSMSGNQTIRLTSVTADRELPLPSVGRQLDKIELELSVDDQPRPLVSDVLRRGNSLTSKWRIELDLAFPEGLAGTLISDDESTIYVLSRRGKLLEIDVQDLFVRRSVDLGAECSELLRSGGRLAAACPAAKKLIVLDEKLAPVAAWRMDLGDLQGGCSTQPWVVTSDSQRGVVRIFDIEQGRLLYHLTGNNLLPIQPRIAGAVPRVRPSRFARSGFSPNGRSFVAIDNALHHFSQRDGSLYYEEDGSEVNCDGKLLLFSDDGRVAVRTDVGIRNNGSLGPGMPWKPGVYSYRLAAMERPAGAYYPPSYIKLLQFDGDELVGMWDHGEVRVATGNGPRGPKLQLLSNWESEPLDIVLLSGGRRIILDSEKSAYLETNQQPPGRFRTVDSKLPLVPAAFEVEQLDVAASIDEELSRFPTLVLPDRIEGGYTLGSHHVAWSPDGAAMFAVLRDGSVVRVDANARRCTHRLKLTDKSRTPQHRLQYLSSCRAGLVLSNGNGSELFVLDFDTLACRGRIDLDTAHRFLGNPHTAQGITVCRGQRCLYVLDLARQSYRRIFPEFIEGLDEQQVKTFTLQMDRTRRETTFLLEAFDSSGELLLLKVGEGWFVMRVGDTWRLEYSLDIPRGPQIWPLAGDRLAIVPTYRQQQTTVFDWTTPRGAENAITLPHNFYSSACLYYDPRQKRFYTYDARQRSLQLFDAKGNEIGHVPKVYAGRFQGNLGRMYGHPARGDTVFSLSAERAIGWLGDGG